METLHHTTTASRYAAQLHCQIMAKDARKVANRTMDPVAAERARLDAAAWMELAMLIRLTSTGSR